MRRLLCARVSTRGGFVHRSDSVDEVFAHRFELVELLPLSKYLVTELGEGMVLVCNSRFEIDEPFFGRHSVSPFVRTTGSVPIVNRLFYCIVDG